MSITDLRANLAHYLAKAKAGEHVVITERGKPIAKLGPAIEDEHWADLIARGVVSPAANAGERRPLAEPMELGEGDWQLSDYVTAMRR